MQVVSQLEGVATAKDYKSAYEIIKMSSDSTAKGSGDNTYCYERCAGYKKIFFTKQ